MNMTTNAEVLAAYEAYIASASESWRDGLALLLEVSSRYGASQPEDFYRRGVRHLATIKPSMQNRAREFFPEPFALPLALVQEEIAEATKHGSFSMVEGATVTPLSGKGAKAKRYAVPTIANDAEFIEAASALIGGRRGLFADMQSRRVVTFGSCFAVNVGRALKERGFSVYSLLVAEDVNSTFNNLHMLRHILLGTETPVSREIAAIPGVDFDVVRAEFARATDVVFTLGNIFRLENAHGPMVRAREGARIRTEAIEETDFYLDEIFSMLAAHTKAKVLVSVSPVPITGYKGDTFQSAIEADCVSKSQLRAVLHSVLRHHPDVTYIPTFEIFRWLAAHQAFPSFGADDGNCRHLSRSHIEAVIDLIT